MKLFPGTIYKNRFVFLGVAVYSEVFNSENPGAEGVDGLM